MPLTLEALLQGYSDPEAGRIVTLDSLRQNSADYKDESRLTVMDPMVSRYLKSIRIINDAGSLMQLSRDRVKVSVEYLIKLVDLMSEYKGQYKGQKVIDVRLTDAQRNDLRKIPGNVTFDDQKQIEYMDSICHHDLAATTDWLKIQLLTRPELGLQDFAEAVHFALTSEDVNSPAFGLINKTILTKSILPTILDFQKQIIDYAIANDQIVAGLTHGQPAEYTTLAKRFMNIASTIDYSLKTFETEFIFPGKMGGAVGNLNDHRAAYSDINWPEFFKDLVEGMGLKYVKMTDQSSSFIEYQDLAGRLRQITRTSNKFGKDLWTSVQNFWYNKMVKKGHKGSSVMAQKFNPWQLEGGKAIMQKGQVMLDKSVDLLINYNFEGDMSRSIITRDMPGDYARIVLGIKRIGDELSHYIPNVQNVLRVVEQNPGMSSAPIMTVLKRAGITGDAYRMIQTLSYNKEDQRPSTRIEFEHGIKTFMTHGIVPKNLGYELIGLLEPSNCLGYAREFATEEVEKCMSTVKNIRKTYDIR